MKISLRYHSFGCSVTEGNRVFKTNVHADDLRNLLCRLVPIFILETSDHRLERLLRQQTGSAYDALPMGRGRGKFASLPLNPMGGTCPMGK